LFSSRVEEGGTAPFIAPSWRGRAKKKEGGSRGGGAGFDILAPKKKKTKREGEFFRFQRDSIGLFPGKGKKKMGGGVTLEGIGLVLEAKGKIRSNAIKLAAGNGEVSRFK